MTIDITDPKTAALFAAGREIDFVYGPDGTLLGKFIPASDLPPEVRDQRREADEFGPHFRGPAN